VSAPKPPESLTGELVAELRAAFELARPAAIVTLDVLGTAVGKLGGVLGELAGKLEQGGPDGRS
jgi:hypothetical protein